MTENDHCEVVYVRIDDGDEEDLLTAPAGATLKDVLVRADRSPHTRLTARANCGGRGLCGTCGVRVDDGLDPDHWHDSLADRWGYPRLSCQLTLSENVRLRIPEKVIWGRRE